MDTDIFDELLSRTQVSSANAAAARIMLCEGLTSSAALRRVLGREPTESEKVTARRVTRRIRAEERRDRGKVRKVLEVPMDLLEKDALLAYDICSWAELETICRDGLPATDPE